MTTETIIQIFIPVSLGIIMFGMGLGLVRDDFRRLMTQPRPVALGAVAQLVMLPAMGFAIAAALGMRGPLAVGLILICASPGGPTSNFLSHVAGGDTALSVTLTALSGTLTIVTLPVVVNLALGAFADATTDLSLPLMGTIGQVFLVVALPVALGMVVRAKNEALATRLERGVKVFAVVFLVVLVVGAVARERARLLTFARLAGPAVLALNVTTMALGYAIGAAGRLPLSQRITLTLEVGMQNAALAMSVALGLMGSTEVAIPAALYGVLMYFSCGAVVWMARAATRRAEATS